MYYFALLLGTETTSAPDPEAQAAEMAAYQNFHAKAASAIRAGDALQPSATGVRITGGPDAPTVTDGPFAESAEVAGGYYVFEAENLDEALALARDIPAAKYGAVEVWPMVDFSPARAPLTSDSWLALLLEPPGSSVEPGSPRWDEGIKAHIEFGKVAGDRAVGGLRCTRPRRRRGYGLATARLLLIRPVEGAEVANGSTTSTQPIRRGDQGGIDDPGDDGGAAAAGRYLRALTPKGQPGQRLSARMGTGRGRARTLVRRPHRRRGRCPGGLRRSAAGLAPRRCAGQRRRMGRHGCPQPRAGPAAARVGPSGKGTRRRGRRHPGPHRSRGRSASGPRRRAADDVYLCPSGAGPAVAAGADAAADLRPHRRRDRQGAAADRSGGGTANHPGQEQDSAREHPAAGTACRPAARTHPARARLYLLGVHRGLLVDRRTLGDPRRAMR